MRLEIFRQSTLTFYDLDDVEGLSIFDDNYTFVTAHGTYVGKDAIRQNLEYTFGLRSEARHYTSNVVVRVNGDITQAVLMGYYWYLGLQVDRPIEGGGGIYESKLKKVGNDWKFVYYCITTIFSHSLPTSHAERTPKVRAEPKPTLP